ncbi:MAG: ferredoxin reductase family protein [Actinomycetales bacterium]
MTTAPMSTRAQGRGVAATPSRRLPSPHAPARTLLALLTAGLAAVVALWAVGHPHDTGAGGLVTEGGRLAGLVAGYGVVLSVVLMARVPWFEQAVGTDVITRWHARIGRTTVIAVVLHGLLVWVGYSATSSTGLLTQGKELLLSYPDVLKATVSGGLLVLVGVISIRAARRRVRHETWYFIHLYTYLALLLAFSHVGATGADFVDNPLARLAWTAACYGAFALAAWYRILGPLALAWRHRVRVLAVRREGPDVVSVILTGKHLEEMGVQSGQFLRWRFLTRGMWYSANPYSLSAPPHPAMLRITVREQGDHSRGLARLKKGTLVLPEGPSGGMTAARRRRRKVLLIAGGIGIGPMRALFETLPGRPGDITLLYRTSSEQDLVLRRELEAIAEARGARLHYLVGRRRDLGYDPLAVALRAGIVTDLSKHDVYLCGPDGMVESNVALLKHLGVPRRHIHSESFAW